MRGFSGRRLRAVSRSAAHRSASAAREAVDPRGMASAARETSAACEADRPRGVVGLWDFGDGFFLSFMAGEMIPDSGGKVNENMLRTEFSRHDLYTSLLVLVHFSFSLGLALFGLAHVRN